MYHSVVQSTCSARTTLVSIYFSSKFCTLFVANQTLECLYIAVARSPRSNLGSAPSRNDNAHRNIYGIGDIFGEEVCYSRTRSARFERCALPLARGKILHRRLLCGVARNIEDADAISVVYRLDACLQRLVYRLIAGYETCQRHLHIGLARTDPNLTDKDIIKLYDLLSAGDLDAVRTSVSGGINRNTPRFIIANLGGVALLAPRRLNHNLRAGSTPTPNGSRCLLLEYHVIREDLCHAQRLCSRCHCRHSHK